MSRLLEATMGHAAIVDDADFERLSAFSWYAHNSGTGCSVEKRPARRTSVREGRKVVFLVHEIVRPPDGMVVDHIDGNPWNNQRANLRICTHSQNMKNRKKHAGSSRNPFKGVYRRGNHYEAKITDNRRLYLLGSYRSAVEAARAYDCAALFLHRDFARLNFDDGAAAPRAPTIIRSAASIRPIRPAFDWAPLVEHVRNGRTVRSIATIYDVSYSGLRNAVKDAGIELHRGRPKLLDDWVQQATRPEAA